MTKTLLVVLAFVLVVPFAFAQDKEPVAAVNLVLAGSIAPIGIGAELFLGNLGLGVTFTFLPLASGDVTFIVYEPGAYAHFYLGEKEGCFYLSAGGAYLSASIDSSEVDTTDLNGTGRAKVFGALGFNALFGKDKGIRFAVELGARYATWFLDGDTVDALIPVAPYFTLLFGKAF